MPLSDAQRKADKLCAWLAPFCEKIIIAGSIRRERPLCNDVDLVAIPKIEPRQVKVDMFTTKVEPVNLLREHLVNYVNSDPVSGAHWKGRDGARGPEPKPDAKNLLLITRAGVQLDVWCATPATLVTRVLCRTGSREHNIWACQRAEFLGGKWQPYEGLRLGGRDIALNSEQDFYDALQVPAVLPADREMEHLRRIWSPSPSGRGPG